MTEQVTPFQTTVVVFTTTGSMVRHSAAFSYSSENSINDNYRMIKGLQNWKHLPVISGWECYWTDLFRVAVFHFFQTELSLSLSLSCAQLLCYSAGKGGPWFSSKEVMCLTAFHFQIKKVFKCKFSTNQQCNTNEI